MKITTSQSASPIAVTIFHIEGDIDASTYGELQRLAREAFDAGTRNLILDLSAVSYVSSAGVRAMNDIFQLLRTAGSESDQAMYQGVRAGTYKSPHLKLVNPKPDVAGVLAMTGMDMFLEIHRDLPAALASFQPA